MHNDVINDYLNRDVEITTSSAKTFTGNLKLHDSQKGIVVLEPKNDRYSSKRYGEVFIRQHDIVSVREVLPRIEEDYYDECEDKQMIGTPDKYLTGVADDMEDDEEKADSSYWKNAKKLTKDITDYPFGKVP